MVVAAVAAMAATTPAPASASATWRSSTVDDVVRWLSMRPATSARCLTPDEAAADIHIAFGASGYVEGWLDRRGAWHPSKTTVLAPGICEAIEALAAGEADEYTLAELAWAVLVVTHESGHLRGHRWSGDEARTECWAIRHVGYVAARLGVTSIDARRLLVGAAVDIHRSELGAEYQLPTCVLPKP